MPRVAAAPLALLAAVCAAALALASCGGGSDAKLLPGGTAQEIKENLDAVQRLVDEGECIEAEEAALQVATQVEELQGIDAELKQVLQRGADRLNEVVDTCEATVEDTVAEPVPETTEAEEAEAEEQKEEEKAAKEEEKELREEEKDAEKAEKEQQKQEEEAQAEEQEEPAKPIEEVEENDEPSGGIGPGGAKEAD
jgi:outer membrane biosynthesis protein TonB